MKRLFLFTLFLLSFYGFGQVGINTTTPNTSSMLDVVSTDRGFLPPRLSLTSTNLSTPVPSHVAGNIVYNTATVNDVFPGLYVNDGTKWERLNTGPEILSVSMTGNRTISSTYPTFANLAGMGTLTFTARRSFAFIIFSASGYAAVNSMSLVVFQIQETGSGAIIAGTNTAMQSYDDVTGTITPWSATYSGMYTGLTPGATYTLQVRGAVEGILGSQNATIGAAAFRHHHVSLTVFP